MVGGINAKMMLPMVGKNAPFGIFVMGEERELVGH